MSAKPRVSVIVPIYNRQALAERSIRSVLAQNLPDMEIILVDDASAPAFYIPDDLADPRLRLVTLAQNGGESAARNAGVAAADADWIAFLDSDDYWIPGTLGPRLAAAEAAYAARPDILTVHAAGFVTDNTRTGRVRLRVPVASADPRMFASGCWFCPGSTSIVRKAAFARVGACDVALRRIQDYEWYLRLALAGGRVEVWPHMAAVVELGAKPSLATFQIAIDHFEAKHYPPDGALQARPELVRFIEAYLDAERAGVMAAEKNWPWTAIYLARSLIRKPRMQVPLWRFWLDKDGPIPELLRDKSVARTG